MRTPAGYILRLSAERQSIFEQRERETSFAEAVPEFQHSRNQPLVCFIFNQNEELTHVGTGRRGQLAGDQQRRLNVDKLEILGRAMPHSELDARLLRKFKKQFAKAFETGGLLSPKLFEAVLQAISEARPEVAALLRMFLQERRLRIGGLPRSAQYALAMQKDAVSTALSIAQIKREVLAGWDYDPGQVELPSFIAGLPKARLREDQMIAHDLNEFPGYEAIRSVQIAATVFKSEQNRLTVVLANRLPLEEQTGADLIYYNETFGCFLMVQYKAMTGDDDLDAIFRFPEQQLIDEIARMDAILGRLGKCANNKEADGYRLNENPFFLKLCPRILFDPDNIGLSKGMYLPLDYWKLISQHPAMVGPQGGCQISYKNVRRYMDNTQFATIVAGAWVGTNIDQSKLIEVAIRDTLASGKAAVIALDEQTDDRHRQVAASKPTTG